MNFQEASEHYARCYILMDGEFCGGLISADDVIKKTIPNLRERRVFQKKYTELYRENLKDLESKGYKVRKADLVTWYDPFYYEYPNSPDAEKCFQEIKDE